MTPAHKIVPCSSPPTTELRASSSSKRRHGSQYVDVSPPVFCLLWVTTLLLHTVCAAYYFVVGRFYATTTVATWLGSSVRFHKIGIDPDAFPTIANVHYAIGSVHCFIIALTIAWSIHRRQLSFGPMQESKSPLRKGDTLRSRDEAKPSWIYKSREFFGTLFSRTGFFGVESESFDMQRVFLEIVEVVLLTIQAYRMSQYVPRRWLNNMFVGILVINCLSTPIVHVLVTRNALMRRVLALVCDSILDLFSSLVIPVILAVIYSKDYDSKMRGFDAALWLDDVWFVNATNEFKLILVASYADLAGRAAVAFGLVASLESAKALIRAHRRSHQGSHHAKTNPAWPKLSSSLSVASRDLQVWVRQTASTHRVCATFHLLLVIWRLVVLVLHFQAATVVQLSSCAMQIRPWLAVKPTCALLLISCHDDAIHRRTDQDQINQWLLPDETRVVRIIIRHCPHYPTRNGTITRMKAFKALKVYNTTIVDWSSDAALTHSKNPQLTTLIFVRVMLPDNGALPDGITSNEFPRAVTVIYFCVINLHSLPADLDKKWPKRTTYIFESSKFETLPDVISRLQPSQLSFARNRFSSFPFEVLQVQGLKFLNFGGNNITSLLPTSKIASVLSPGTIRYFFLEGTNISILPRWLDSLLSARLRTGQTGLPPLFVGDTPLCRETALVQAGKLHSYPEVSKYPTSELSFAMSLTSSNASALSALSFCIPRGELFYPLAVEDAASGLIRPQ